MHLPGWLALVSTAWLAASAIGCGSVIEQTDGDVARDGEPEGTEAEADHGADADADADTDVGADADADAEVDVGADADAEADADGDEVPAPECLIEDIVYVEGGVNPANECQWCQPAVHRHEWTPRPDFTRCRLHTEPDREYDICSGGVCVSPGCGTADCNAPGPNWDLPDTNQRRCYSDAAALAEGCLGRVGDANCGTTSFCGQDAQYGWDLTHAASARFARSASSAEPTVIDNVTDLVWQGCLGGQSGAACAGGAVQPFTWQEALAWCNNLEWAGFADWRLPGRHELQTLADFGGLLFADRATFPGFPSAGTTLWTSSSSSSSPAEAWVVAFAPLLSLDEHAITPRRSKAVPSPVRCVRGPSHAGPLQRFVRSEPAAGQLVVLDAATGLVWQGCVAGRERSACDVGFEALANWQQALAFCENLLWAGSSDWRLPNVTELTSLVDDRRGDPAIDTAAFPATAAGPFWSSTTADPPSQAWTVDFRDGGLRLTVKGTNSGVYLRCVRGGEFD